MVFMILDRHLKPFILLGVRREWDIKLLAFEVSTYNIEFLRLALWLGTTTLINLFFFGLRLFGYEITRRE